MEKIYNIIIKINKDVKDAIEIFNESNDPKRIIDYIRGIVEKDVDSEILRLINLIVLQHCGIRFILHNGHSIDGISLKSINDNLNDYNWKGIRRMTWNPIPLKKLLDNLDIMIFEEYAIVI